MSSNTKQVKRYYHSLESIIGYRLVVGGVKHFGIHPDAANPVSIAEAQNHENEVIAKALELSPSMKILECGCGEGSSANYIAAKYNVEITGIDLLPRNITRAKQTAKKQGNANEFLVADYMELPFADNTFDVVYAMETLVHSPDVEALFRGIRRVLKPGGTLVFCEYSMTPRNKISAPSGEIITKMNRFSSMPGLESFTTGAFPEILEKAGFKDIQVTDYTPNFLPTLHYFWKLGHRPMKLIRKLKLENHFVNAYSAVNIYDAHVRGEELIQYNLVRATANK